MGKISHILIFKEETYNKNLEVSILTLLYKKKKEKKKQKEKDGETTSNNE